MIAFDTNTLLRLVVSDDADQGRRANALFQNATKDGIEIYISIIVLVEAIWTLRSRYQFSKDFQISVIERLLSDQSFVLANRGAIEAALFDWREGAAGFADYLIAHTARTAGATTTYTFDTQAGRSPGFSPVPA